MHITFYKSNLCPRCHMVGKQLRVLAFAEKGLQVEEVDVLTSPRRAWRDGIRMIPALKSGEELLSGFLLSSEVINNFIAAVKEKP